MSKRPSPFMFLRQLSEDFRKASAAGQLGIVADVFAILGVSLGAAAAQVYLSTRGLNLDFGKIFFLLAFILMWFVVFVIVLGVVMFAKDFLYDSSTGLVIYYSIVGIVWLLGLAAFATFIPWIFTEMLRNP